MLCRALCTTTNGLPGQTRAKGVELHVPSRCSRCVQDDEFPGSWLTVPRSNTMIPFSVRLPIMIMLRFSQGLPSADVRFGWESFYRSLTVTHLRPHMWREDSNRIRAITREAALAFVGLKADSIQASSHWDTYTLQQWWGYTDDGPKTGSARNQRL